MNNVMSCPTCDVALVPFEKKASVSAGGLLGALIFLCGLPVLIFNVIIGILIMILGVIIGVVGRSKIRQMVCPQCGYKRDIPK